MALSRQNVIFAALAALLSWSATSHWLPSLRLVPYSFAGGVLATLLTVTYLLLFNVKATQHSTERLAPVASLSLSTQEDFHAAVQILRARRYQPNSYFKSYDPQLSRSLEVLLQHVCRDFVKSWFKHISQSDAFPRQVDRALRQSISNISARIFKLDISSLIVKRILPILNQHLDKFLEAERAVRGKDAANDTETEEHKISIAAKYCGGIIHPAASLAASRTSIHQEKHLRQILKKTLPMVLPSEMLTSLSVTILIREIVACAVLLPVFQLIVDPDFINQQIEAYGRSVYHDRKNVQKLRAALDQHASPPSKKSRTGVETLMLQTSDDEQSFERWIRVIRNCESLPKAKRLRNEIDKQLKSENEGYASSVLYFRRLEIGRSLLDQKIDQLRSEIPSYDRRQKNGVLAVETGIARTHRNFLRSPELRRTASSTTNLFGESRRSETMNSRRSLDDISRHDIRSDNGHESDPSPRSSPRLGQSQGLAPPPPNDQSKAVDAVQAALDNIVDDEPLEDNIFSNEDVDSETASLASFRTDLTTPSADTRKPSLASLGLIGSPVRPNVFTHDDLFGEREKLWEDEKQGSEADDAPEEDGIKEAAPGDLGLTEVVQSLSVEIDKMEAQLSIVNPLMDRAELTNNAAELRVLRKSKDGLEKDIEKHVLQRQQYIVQENDNTLFGKASVAIKSVMVGTERDGHEFALYVVEVKRQGTEAVPEATWAVTRRYSEFHRLHRRLRYRFSFVRELEFPRRQVVTTLQKDFLKKRRYALERYLNDLLKQPAICRSLELRAFLSQQAIRPLDPAQAGHLDRQDFVTRIYSSVTDGMEEFLGNVPALDQLSVAGQNLISAATSATGVDLLARNEPGRVQSNNNDLDNKLYAHSNPIDDPSSAAEAQAEITAFESQSASETSAMVSNQQASKHKTSFIAPIAAGFLTLFQLNSGNAWLRGRAIVVVLQQILGGTVERRVRESLRSLVLAPSALSKHLDSLWEAVWPGGVLREAPKSRPKKERESSRAEARIVLMALFEETAGGIVGRNAAKEAGKRMSRVINNERLNAHVAFTILDEVVEAVFGGDGSA